VSANTALQYLWCDSNQLTTLNVSTNTALTSLHCSINQLTTLNVSTNTALQALDCYNNSLTGLNVSANTALTGLSCAGNQITGLNVSTNTALMELNCSGNELTSLNVKNGNNTAFGFFSATGNPNLQCIEVDNVAYSNANWALGKDPSAVFSTNCAIISIAGHTLNAAGISIYPSPSTGIFSVETNRLSEMSIGVYDLTGKCIFQKLSSDLLRQSIDLSHEPRGVYFVKVMADDRLITKKIVIH
jgi:Leucine-rich repeat (LRR) protein